MCYACMYIYTPNVCWVPEEGEGMDVLELELQMVVNYFVYAGNRT